MGKHIFLLLPTTKFLGKSFVFKNNVAKEGLPRDARLAWAQEVPSSNLGAPTTYFFSANATFLLILIRVFNYKPASL